MDDIKNVSLEEIVKSTYVVPMKMHYDQDGIKKNWDVIKSHSSVSVILHDIVRDVFIFVKQFRPAVYLNNVERMENGPQSSIDTSKYPGSLGLTIELCAGIIDKDMPLVNIVQEEIMEECGYEVPIEKIEKITSLRGGVGLTGSTATLFYAAVTPDMKKNKGGGNPAEGEFIEIEEVPVDKIMDFVMDESINKPVSMAFALMWFQVFKRKSTQET